MQSLVEIYLVTIVCGAVAAAALALIGCHLATRDKSMQTICISQGAMLGVLLGIGFLGHSETHSLIHLAPNISGVLISAAVFLLTEYLTRKHSASPNSLFISIFGLLLAMSYLVSALFPALESHLAQVYFGDLATLCREDAIATTSYSALTFAVMAFFFRPLTKQSFQTALFGQNLAIAFDPKWFILFNIVAITMLSVSIQFLGFLFTVSCLFLPTVILSRLPVRGLVWHFVLCTVLAVVGSVMGFLVSLHFKTLPTVPSIALTMAALGLLALLVSSPFLTKKAAPGNTK